jgi:hypothetical protein
MLLAPVLAIVLALSLAGALSIFPQNQPEAAHINFTPAPTSPSTVPPRPQAMASSADLFFVPLLAMCVFAIVIVAIAVGLLFFREKNLKAD